MEVCGLARAQDSFSTTVPPSGRSPARKADGPDRSTRKHLVLSNLAWNEERRPDSVSLPKVPYHSLSVWRSAEQARGRLLYVQICEAIIRKIPVERSTYRHEHGEIGMPAEKVPAPEYRHDVFVSYSHHDKKWVQEVLVKNLVQNRLNVIIDDDFDLGFSSADNMNN